MGWYSPDYLGRTRFFSHMLSLKPIELADKQWVDELVAAEDSPSADFSFGIMYLWDDLYSQKIGRIGDRLLVMPHYKQEPFFAWPVGSGPLKPVLDAMTEYLASVGAPLLLRGVTNNHLAELEAIDSDIRVTRDRNTWDYLYTVEKLSSLSGKKLHGKRNHIHRFEAAYSSSFRPMTAADGPECLAFLDAWLAARDPAEAADLEDEKKAIHRAFTFFDELELEGGMLYADGRLAAFCLGEKISSDTFDVHFEKALTEVEGAYSVINHRFASLVAERHPEIRFLNREDDAGDEGLRRAKESYYPDAMVEKHSVYFL